MSIQLNYRIEFAINTYEKKAARLECTITGLETENYDQRLEELKIALKNRLDPDWEVCTWLVDMQSAQLCKEAYERAFIIENNLRAFASKVLPVPGGPTNSAPFGSLAPISIYLPGL